LDAAEARRASRPAADREIAWQTLADTVTFRNGNGARGAAFGLAEGGKS
jgi:hypothetical protein